MTRKQWPRSWLATGLDPWRLDPARDNVPWSWPQRPILEPMRGEAMPNIAKFDSLPAMKKAVKVSGNHFFDREAMEFFNSKIETPLFSGSFFVTSEYMDDPADTRYTARYFTHDEETGTYSHRDIGGFNVHETVALAKAAIFEFQANLAARKRLETLLWEVGLRAGTEPDGDSDAFYRVDGEYLLGYIWDDGKAVSLIEGNMETHIPMSDFTDPRRFAEHVRQQVDAKIADWLAE